MKCELGSCKNEAIYLADIGLSEPAYVCGSCFSDNKFWRRRYTFIEPSDFPAALSKLLKLDEDFEKYVSELLGGDHAPNRL